jgi:ammonium transporter, Amt family
MGGRITRARARGGCFFLSACVVVLGLAPSASAAATAAQVNGADVAWLLTSAALVLMMTIPGLALFYGGLVRRKNVLSTVMHSFILAAVISIQWVLFGYSIAFAPGTPLFGSLHWVGLSGVSATVPYAAYSATVPHQAFMIYQCMFAIITPALITGAIAERMSFRGFLLFSILWATLIYDPLAHWVWGAGGWLHALGALDFAGGTVVHISSGTAALAGALMLGKRMGYPREPTPPHNVVLSVTGAGLLWVGWFGFNAGSALAATGLAVSAFVATHLGASAAAVGWMATEWMVTGKPTVLGAASGAVAGLVAITPAAGFVAPMPAIIIGLAAGAICFFAVRMKPRLGYDDALDVVGVHAVGGIFGALATGLFASVAVNPAGANGLFYGHPAQLLIQAAGVAATVGFSFVGSMILLKITDALVGIRVDEDEEQMGLDLSQHEESAYAAEA